MLGPAEIFTLLFVTLGPMKLLGPFLLQTRDLEAKALRSLALRVFVLALAACLLGALVGSALLAKWRVSIPALLIATGIVFFLVALRLVLERYEPHAAVPPAPLPDKPMAAALRLTFPAVATPHGVAALIVLIAASDRAMLPVILGLLVLVLVVDLLAMLFVRQLMRGVFLLVLQLLGAVLGVLQVALAVQIILRGLRELGVVPA